MNGRKVAIAILVTPLFFFLIGVATSMSMPGANRTHEAGFAGIGIAIMAPVVIAYCFPAIVALSRKHPNTLPITLLNIFLGWTLIGWFGALIWSVCAIRKAA